MSMVTSRAFLVSFCPALKNAPASVQSCLSVTMSRLSPCLSPIAFFRMRAATASASDNELTLLQDPVLPAALVRAPDIQLLARGVEHVVDEVVTQPGFGVGVDGELPDALEVVFLHLQDFRREGALFFGFQEEVPCLLLALAEFFHYPARPCNDLILVSGAFDDERVVLVKRIALVDGDDDVPHERALDVFRRGEGLPPGNVAHAARAYPGALEIFPVQLLPHIGVRSPHPAARAVFLHQADLEAGPVLFIDIAPDVDDIAPVHGLLDLLVP